MSRSLLHALHLPGPPMPTDSKASGDSTMTICRRLVAEITECACDQAFHYGGLLFRHLCSPVPKPKRWPLLEMHVSRWIAALSSPA